MRKASKRPDRPVMISDARRQLFQLFDRVTLGEGQVVRIARKGRGTRVMLVREEYVEGLEATVEALTRRLQGAPRAAEPPFSLIGSATLNVPADEVLRASRARQGELAAAKLRTLAG
ncbi:MAG: hypothetical protein WKG32_13555 [Gemmatimonadaceae bacterium]